MLTDDVNETAPEGTLFVSAGHREAFACSGDDSRICCDFPSAHVIAYGRVRGPELTDPRLCRPAP
jgi:hypothetical protein